MRQAPPADLLDCHHHVSGECRSCRWIEVPLGTQLDRKVARATAAVGTDGVDWEAPARNTVSGFRNKAKMAVGGTVTAPTLGLVALDGSSVDLRDCALHSPGLVAALPVLAAFVATARIEPYALDRRAGELKHLLVTESPTGELMVRFVVRSTECLARVRKHLPGLLEALPAARVVTLNVQPEHKAVLEGEQEVVLTDDASLPMPLALPGGTVSLNLRPQSFFQTSTPMATELYATAARWVSGLDAPPDTLWDLYCGVGGFALTLAAPGRRVLGVELSTEAVAAGNAAAPAGVRFVAGDATEVVRGLVAEHPDDTPDLVVVNPPRRGIGDLAALLEASTVRTVLYSSCNVDSLAVDLAAMPSLAPVRARVLDMFPHTDHFELLVLLSRR